MNTVYVIVDEHGKLFKEFAAFSKMDVIEMFVKSWIGSRIRVSTLDCETIWKHSFAKNDWTVRELSVVPE